MEDAPVCVPVGDKPEGSTRVYRHASVADKELTCVPWPDRPEINTAYHVFETTSAAKPDHPCLGHRPIVDGHAGDYVFQNYSSVAEEVKAIGGALANQGLGAGAPVSIFAINRPEWIKVLLALWSQSLVCVPLYDTLGASSVEFILNDAEVTTVFVAENKLERVLEVANACSTLRTIIQFEPVTDDQRKKCAEQAPNVRLLSLQEILDAGRASPVPPKYPSPEGLAYIMYTSGTTGNPKGVMLTHKNVLASASGVFAAGVTIRDDDVYFSYLPLAHSFETVMQIGGLIGGASVGFFQGDVRKLTDDIAALRPTVFAGVPRVYSRIYDRVMQAVAEGSFMKRMLFEKAYATQAENIEAGRPRSGFWDSLVFSKTAQRLGGRIRLMATGAAPMPQHLHTFMQVVFMAPLLQGYGLTENSAAAAVTPLGYRFPGRIGGPIPCTEMKLVDVPEMEYLSTDQPPRGEVCLRGANVFQGYFKLDDKTKEALDDDGWLHTGDIGRINDDNSFSIIDRKKNIFKLSQGEYVAAEELENVFQKAPSVGQVFVYGDSEKTCVVAVVVPSIEVIKPWCQQNGIEGNMAAICENPAVKAHVFDEIKAEAKAAKLASFKIPRDIYLEGEVNELGMGFTVENDTMTPTFKLRRPQLKKRYLDKIDAMYVALGEGATQAK